jgi:hypothetical protein
VHNGWVDKNKECPDGRVKLLEASSAAAKAVAQDTVDWRVVTQTSNIFGAGTDAPVSI